MPATLLRAASHRRMPWKNGQGETTEIAVFPPNAGIADFGWRVSMAQIAADGPFSSFPGVDRTLSILSGQGIRLVVDASTTELRLASAPFSFLADAPTHAWLLAGPVTDLNVMTRRTDWTHRVRQIAPEQHSLTLDGAVALAVCTSGEVELSNASAAFHLDAGDALLVADDADGPWQLRANPPSQLYSIALDPSPSQGAQRRDPGRTPGSSASAARQYPD